MKQDRRHASGLEHDATTSWRFRQFAGDSLRRRLGLALANHHAFAIENANMRLIHRDIEASEIVHVGSPLPHPGRSYRPSQKNSRSLPDVEKLLLLAAKLGIEWLSAKQGLASSPHVAKI